MKKTYSKRVGESETGPILELPENYSNERTQNKNCALLRCKSAKCYNECYKYNTKECPELHDKLNHSQQGREKYKNLKKEIKEQYLGKENTDVGIEEVKIPV